MPGHRTWGYHIHEVNDAIKKLMNGRALGNDNVYAEMLKAEEQETPQLLLRTLSYFNAMK